MAFHSVFITHPLNDSFPLTLSISDSNSLGQRKVFIFDVGLSNSRFLSCIGSYQSLRCGYVKR